MKWIGWLFVSLCTWAGSNAWAVDDLAEKKKVCLQCHAVDRKLVGPSYKDVAARYATQKDAADKLAAKVLNGGSGVWGPVPMPAMSRPPYAKVSEAEARELVHWVLSHK